ncbi:MAG: hypothetical protein ABR541_03995 [Candidatus Dormibacteria bacterium]
MTRRVFPTGLVEDALRSVLGAVKDVVPMDAQLHLLAAQRELILAVAALIEHHVEGAAEGEEPAPSTPGDRPSRGRNPTAGRSRSARSRRPTRVSLD